MPWLTAGGVSSLGPASDSKQPYLQPRSRARVVTCLTRVGFVGSGQGTPTQENATAAAIHAASAEGGACAVYYTCVALYNQQYCYSTTL